MNTFEQINAILREVLEDAPEDIHEFLRLREDLGCDSLDLTDIIMELEEDFSIQFTDEDEKSLRTVNDLYRMVINKCER